MLTLFAIFTRKPKRKKKITVTKLPSGEGELTPVFLNPERAEEFAKNYLKLNPKKVGKIWAEILTQSEDLPPPVLVVPKDNKNEWSFCVTEWYVDLRSL